jgi:predicted transcriptional regulator
MKKTYKRWADIKHKNSPEVIEKIRGEVREEIMEENLRGIREAAGKTQQEVAAAMKVSQSLVSAAESREDPRLSTLRRYVHALGGELEIIANFGDKRIRLHGV